MTILLILKAIVSYRSVPRILNLFNTTTTFKTDWIPHFTSVINWTSRFGLGLLKQIEKINEPWVAIIDHSIDIGTKKALVILRVKLDVFKNKKEAIFGNAGVETEYKAGDKVVHAEHGNGTIIMVAGDVLNIAFDGQGMKKILASSSPISKI